MPYEPKGERVRKVSPSKANARIDRIILNNIEKYSRNHDTIKDRLKQLDKEWDIERVLELNMSILALTGIVLAVFVNVYWLILTGVVLLFFLEHAIHGWCPPIPVFRFFNVRTRPEIDREKYALKSLRGDFIQKQEPATAEEAFEAVTER